MQNFSAECLSPPNFAPDSKAVLPQKTTRRAVVIRKQNVNIHAISIFIVVVLYIIPISADWGPPPPPLSTPLSRLRWGACRTQLIRPAWCYMVASKSSAVITASLISTWNNRKIYHWKSLISLSLSLSLGDWWLARSHSENSATISKGGLGEDAVLRNIFLRLTLSSRTRFAFISAKSRDPRAAPGDDNGKSFPSCTLSF